jgi:hypothetical protein
LTVSSRTQIGHLKIRASQSTSSVGSIRESSIGDPHEEQCCGPKHGGNIDLSKLGCDMARSSRIVEAGSEK